MVSYNRCTAHRVKTTERRRGFQRATGGSVADGLVRANGVVAAHQRHAKAWRTLQAAINRLPDAYQGDEFMNSLYSLFHDDGKNGRTLGGDVIKTVQRVNESYAEVYTSAESYGIAFDSK